MSQFMKTTQTDSYDILNLDPSGNEFSYASNVAQTEAAARQRMESLAQQEWNEGHTLRIVKRTTTVSYEVMD